MNNATPDQTDEYPLVSAIMLAGRDSIPDVLAGIRCFQAQTYPYKELIIVNNAKNQFAASELNIKAESDIFVVDTPQEMPAGMARNTGVRAANGQIIAQFDADSYHHPQRLEAQIATIAENEAHICILSEVLQYSFVSGRASIYNNEKQAILNTMVFLRYKIDYSNFSKHEEFELLTKMIKADLKPITMAKPELYCKFHLADERAKTPTNNGLTKKQFQAIKKILKGRYDLQHVPKPHPIDQKTEGSESPEPLSVDK